MESMVYYSLFFNLSFCNFSCISRPYLVCKGRKRGCYWSDPALAPCDIRMIRVSGCFAVLQCSGSPVSPKQSAWFFGFSPWIKDSFFPILGVSNLVIGFDFGSWRPQLVGQENLSNFCQQRGWRATEILESLKHHFERISHSLTIFTIHCLFSR